MEKNYKSKFATQSMEKEDLILLVQLLNTIEEMSYELKNAFDKKEQERVEAIKKDMLKLQKKVEDILA